MRGGAEKVLVIKIDLNKSRVLQITSGEAQRAETSALMLQASLFQVEHSHFQLSHSAFGVKLNGLVSPGFLLVSPSASQCSGVTLTPWFYAQGRLGHHQIQAPSSHGKLKKFSAWRDT